MHQVYFVIASVRKN